MKLQEKNKRNLQEYIGGIIVVKIWQHALVVFLFPFQVQIQLGCNPQVAIGMQNRLLKSNW